ncbi:hypothetical protein CF328_g1493 [Tilletia controversa]|nr:hypothetical protein CF328_g1493 [Tilletia controversa]
MQTSFTSVSGNTVTFDIDSSEAVDKLTKKIHDKEGAPLYEQRLTLDGDRLQDDRTISNNRIRHESLLERCLALGGFTAPTSSASATLPTFHSNKTLSGRTVIIEIESSEIADKLATKIQDKDGVSIYEQRLAVHGNRPHNNSTISNDSTQGETSPDRNHALAKSREPASSASETMRIFIDNFLGEIFVLEVKPREKIDSVMDKIEAKRHLVTDHSPATLTFSPRDIKAPISSSSSIMQTIHSVNTISGKILTIEIDSSETTVKVTTKVQDNEGVSLFKNCLTLDGDMLEQFPPERCRVLEGSSGSISLASETMRLFCEYHGGKSFIVEVHPSATVRDVLIKIKDKVGMPHDRRFLYQTGTNIRLDPVYALSDYGIEHDDTIFLSDN